MRACKTRKSPLSATSLARLSFAPSLTWSVLRHRYHQQAEEVQSVAEIHHSDIANYIVKMLLQMQCILCRIAWRIRKEDASDSRREIFILTVFHRL